MKRVGLCALMFVLSACDLIKVDTGQTSSGGTGTDTTSSGSPSDAGGVVQGSGCVIDPNTGVTLCAAINTCPGLTIGSDTFQDCGFRVKGTGIDVECSCQGQLCPLGATTCAEVTTALSQLTQQFVCNQLSTGGCSGSSGGSSSSSSGSGCDPLCRSECAGDPTCYVACGC